MQNLIHPVLLCGGAGSRLWPLSRKSHPKQFVKLLGEESLFQSAARRFLNSDFTAPSVVTSFDFRFVVVEQLAALEIAANDILIEPEPRNTAAAVCAAALSVQEKDDDGLLLIAPSDHVIPDNEQFILAVKASVNAARAGQLITFGIRPNRAETGYGWLELSTKPSPEFLPIPQKINSFIEKPSREKAQKFLENGAYLWNSGIFLFSTSEILRAFKKYAPDTLAKVRESLAHAQNDLSFTRLAAEPWGRLEDVSIDYAVMERASNLSVVPYGGSWSDLGDWASVWRESNPDNLGMVIKGRSTAIECSNSLIHATSDKQELVAIGVQDNIVIAMPDAVLVAHKDKVQEVKIAVSHLRARGVEQAEQHPIDFRPWGWFETIADDDAFRIKKIVVNPGASLSLQSHKFRSEHWVVVSGTAKVTVNSDVSIITENQSVYIPAGAIHRLENSGEASLIVIEVQTGSYFGEDDIVRYEDLYARISN